jgi:hypothetical protein
MDGPAQKPSIDTLSPQETARRRDDALRRALSTPPQTKHGKVKESIQSGAKPARSGACKSGKLGFGWSRRKAIRGDSHRAPAAAERDGLLATEFRIDRPDGTVRGVSLRTDAFLGPTGRPDLIISGRQDITEIVAARERRSQASGIGLAIVKRKVDSHDGLIWIESAPTVRGTTFVFIRTETTSWRDGLPPGIIPGTVNPL